MDGSEARGTGRAGRYLRQPTGYRAFLPAPLPPNPPLRMNDFQAALATASHALGRLDGSVLILPNPDLFVLMYVRKEAVLSCQNRGDAELAPGPAGGGSENLLAGPSGRRA